MRLASRIVRLEQVIKPPTKESEYEVDIHSFRKATAHISEEEKIFMEKTIKSGNHDDPKLRKLIESINMNDIYYYNGCERINYITYSKL